MDFLKVIQIFTQQYIKINKKNYKKSTLFTNLTPYQNRDLQINQYGTAFSRAGE